ncbi:MAG: molecular chaperone HtpG, partial [Burkholderiales bacterium PBB5]
DDQAKEQAFWNEFGPVLKEGIGEDFANRERLAKLFRFASTTAAEGVSFADYVSRMKEGQEAIYVITADSLAAAKSSPQLEIFKKKGIEVLLLTDRVDEWLLSHLYEFEGKPLQSVAKGGVDLGKLTLARRQAALAERAKDVRATSRLVDSPACLVVDEGDMSGHLARMLKQAGQSAPASQPILEVNAEHSLVQRLAAEPEGSARFADLAQVLFDQAQLAEGGQLDDPAAYVARVNRLLSAA